MNINQEIAKALGKTLWQTDSFIPEYNTGQMGPWQINPGGQLANDWGYYSGTCLLEMLPSLLRQARSDQGTVWDTWMSLTPHEIESQELGYQCAFGHVVIMGLGMGWIAANAALNPIVTAVTVIERDADVIALFDESGAYDSIPAAARKKINVIKADAVEWRPDPEQPVDFLYADIWLGLAEPGTLSQARQMQSHVRAKQVYFWGQEIALAAAMKWHAGVSNERTMCDLQQAVTEVIKLPLLIPDDRDYLQMIQQVIDNRAARGLTNEFKMD
ncbi:hypothetical protein OS175_04395 [Marinicella sp. S1101]|uniref:class I SAM-dependent methyltransferase n=1 Tax=Marinicella marina TaxID=2996016 RepID=UPI002260B7C1|nr:hypothetical protein [Marinicella marina]MCX7553107.1 hypothetical protein [Marinicella marina]MDJ1138839.1 hypothetical protein [Marinicella marina]